MILPDYLHMHLSNRRRSTVLIEGKMTQNRPTSWTSAQLSSAKLTAYSADKTCRSGTNYTNETRGLEQEHETMYLWIPGKRFKENIPTILLYRTCALITRVYRVPLPWMNIRYQISLNMLNETTRHQTTLSTHLYRNSNKTNTK